MYLSFLSARVNLSAALSAAITVGLFSFSANRSDAQITLVPDTPVVGSSNPISAEPRVTRLQTEHCTVNLFSNLEFADFNAKNFTYTPPPDCPGPYAKIIFAADFTVTAGTQYDRTAEFYIGGANVFFGTTAEPGKSLSPAWHVENDVTELSATFAKAQPGTAILGNYVGVYNGVNYNGIIYSSAHLVFYPALPHQNPPAKVPDIVIGIPGNSGAGTLNTTSSVVTQSVTLPTNVEAAYLDVIAQSQSNDEFWYLCVPDSLSTELQSCGSTGFRETEISIDGVPAGVAPIYPWIYTGGIDPLLWRPIPGVETLNFKPFRVDLTPFAGVLSNGKAHTVGISVFNADSYFAAEGNLLIYTDKGSKSTTGSVISNSLSAEPTENVNNQIAVDKSGNISGSVTVSSTRSYSIVGSLKTSHGEVTTQVNGLIDFSNKQTFIIDNSEYKQYLVQSTKGGISTTTTAGGVTVLSGQAIDYPFTFDYDEVVNSDGTIVVHNISDQQKIAVDTNFGPGQGIPLSDPFSAIPYIRGGSNEVYSSNDLHYDANGNYTGNSGYSTQNYIEADTVGNCYSQVLNSNNGILTSYKDGGVCQALPIF